MPLESLTSAATSWITACGRFEDSAGNKLAHSRYTQKNGITEFPQGLQFIPADDKLRIYRERKVVQGRRQYG